VLDFSEEGLIETIQNLNGAGIKYTGAGMNEKEAEKPVILTKKTTLWECWVLRIMNRDGRLALTPVGLIILIFPKRMTAIRH
ncbi:MAG TPA: CapA family protein, partial [Mucilaginibacter sp.]